MSKFSTTGFLVRATRSFFSTLLILLVSIYRYTISPFIHMIAPGSGCRFQPTCSQYAIEAIQEHGPVKGCCLAIKRLARCHPWGGHGYDPVPHNCKVHSNQAHPHFHK